jgi:glycosyltransferase involved in cell wall biosynthesis
MTDADRGRVSVVIPARNEQATIERVVRSVARQEHVAEIIIADDQSDDRTGEILARLKAEIPGLQVVRTDPLPAGWTGKAHAVATAARLASAEWLLLTDADTEHLPGSLAALLALAESKKVDLLSLSPGQETPTWWEKAVIPLVYTELARRFRFEDVSDPASPVAAANGQYILIRRGTYESAGGHAAVRGEILEDVALARRVKSAGGKLLFLPGANWVRTRMYRSFPEMWRGWTKNLFLLYERRLGKVLGRVAKMCLFDLFPPMAFVVLCALVAVGRGGAAVSLAALGCFLLALVRQWRYSQALRNLGFESSLANYQVPGAALVALLLLNSARAHVWGGEVNWKGRNYSTKGQG